MPFESDGKKMTLFREAFSFVFFNLYVLIYLLPLPPQGDSKNKIK